MGGSAAPRLIGHGKAFREGCHHRWLRLDTPDDLARLCAGTTGQKAACLLLLMDADSDRQIETSCTQMSSWRFALESSQRLLGRPLPVYLLFLDGMSLPPASLLTGKSAWQPCRTVKQAHLQLELQRQALDQDALSSSPGKRAALMTTLSHTHASMTFIQTFLLPRLLPETPLRHAPLLAGIGWMDAGQRDARAEWRNAAHQLSALRLHSYSQPWPDHPPLPESVTRQLPAILSCPTWIQHQAAVATLLAIVFCIVSASSAWNNRQQIHLVAAALQAFHSLKPHQEPARAQAVQTLRTWKTRLEAQSAAGTTLRTGWGFYQGARMIRALNHAISHYHPARPAPQVLRLNNTALFDSGKATLKPEAKLALQSVLVWIQTHPNRRVRVDGHTDNTGKAAFNLALSTARARAVRDWLVNASSFPPTHFSVQGLGETQPHTSNDNEENKSLNRRVEITLEQDADHPAARTP